MFRIALSLSLLLFASSLPNRNDTKLKSLWNLERVTECVCGYSAINYNDYGCWCGAGGCCTPVDGIDECCKMHDLCYDKAVDDKICINVPEEYVDPYDWTCSQDHKAVCTEKPGTCAAAMCACDVAVANCWKKFPKPLHKAKCNHVPRFFEILDAQNSGEKRQFQH